MTTIHDYTFNSILDFTQLRCELAIKPARPHAYRKLEDKTQFLKRANPVVPTDFLPPPPKTPGVSTFRLDASPCAVAGWVDQTSPACAAAVVAGAGLPLGNGLEAAVHTTLSPPPLTDNSPCVTMDAQPRLMI